MRDEAQYLVDMLDSASRIQRHIQGVSYKEFPADETLQDAILWRLIVIGEAGKKISAAMRQSLPQIPFDNITRMRDRLAHVYRRIDYDIVWDTATNGISDLITHLVAHTRGATPPGGGGAP
jgi:uncharacterized protein with HEPN domain